MSDPALLLNLPNEIILKIGASRSGGTDYSAASLCRVSKFLHTMFSKRELYRTVILHSTSLNAFYQAICSHPERAGWVKDMTYVGFCMNREVFDAILALLTGAVSLEMPWTETLSGLTGRWFPLLQFLKFTGRCYYLRPKHLESFLNRHTSLNHLDLGYRTERVSSEVVLPNVTVVQATSCDSDIFPFLKPTRQLTSISLWLGRSGKNLASILAQHSACRHLLLIVAYPLIACEKALHDIFQTVLDHLPDIISFRLILKNENLNPSMILSLEVGAENFSS
ncbi:hypothetical protein C8J56DRAFT_1066091 [Mycena floridula]|nr:hypothetical protein C8J56DRAFT_1066091 [Mycena floridula]